MGAQGKSRSESRQTFQNPGQTLKPGVCRRCINCIPRVSSSPGILTAFTLGSHEIALQIHAPHKQRGAELARAKCLTVRRTKDVQCQNQALLRDCFVPDNSGLLPAILKFSSGRHCSEVSSRWGKTPCWYLPVSPNRRAGAVGNQ